VEIEPTALPSKKCSRTITALTELGSSKVRNAKPLDRPVSGSRIIVHASTFVAIGLMTAQWCIAEMVSYLSELGKIIP
jgi:hypothetical protein